MSEDIKLLSLGNMEKIIKESRINDNPTVAALCNLHDYAENLAKTQAVPVSELGLVLALIEAMIVQQLENKSKNKN
jgi:hypothetical protein